MHTECKYVCVYTFVYTHIISVSYIQYIQRYEYNTYTYVRVYLFCLDVYIYKFTLYTCMYMHSCIYVCACVHLNLFCLNIHIYKFTCYTCIYVHSCIYVCACVHLDVFCLDVYTYKYICYTHMYVHTSWHVWLHVCIYMYKYIDEFRLCNLQDVGCEKVWDGVDTLQHTATHCNTIQHAGTDCGVKWNCQP